MKKIIAIFLLVIGYQSFSQTNSTPEVSLDGYGYRLRKEVILDNNDFGGTGTNPVKSGQQFEYRIWYTLPPEAANVQIIDEIPPELEYIDNNDPGNTGFSISTNTVTYSVPSGTTTGESHSYTIKVRFPCGTCNGTVAQNKAKLAFDNLLLETNYLDVTAFAFNSFEITKKPQLPSLDGQYNGVVDGNVTYRLSMSRTGDYAYSVPISITEREYWGHQYLSNVTITDIVPTGAYRVLMSGTQECPGGTSLSFPIPDLNPCSGNHPTRYNCYLTIHYPAANFPATNPPSIPPVENHVSYTGTSCGENETNVGIPTQVYLGEASAGGLSTKTLHISNEVPGCVGLYRINIVNSGNILLGPYTIIDNIPFNEIDILKIGYNGISLPLILYLDGISSYSDTPNSGEVIWNPTTPTSYQQIKIELGDAQHLLPIGFHSFISIVFRIKSSLPVLTPVINTGTTDCPQLDQVDLYKSFIIDDYEPKVCLNKSLCNTETYFGYDDIVRYRLRIENNGSGFLTGATITDNLDLGLEYIGNEIYYSSQSANPACGGEGQNAWSCTTSNSLGNQTLTWTIPPLPPYCETTIELDGCSPAGTPYYFIEFDVKVRINALAGNLYNEFTLSGGGINPNLKTSNNFPILIANVFDAKAEKFVSINGSGGPWVKNATAGSNSDVWFRLQYRNYSNYDVKDIVLIDMLPIDYSLSGPDDRMMLNRFNPNNRGSQFDIRYNHDDLPLYQVLNSAPPFTAPDVKVDDTYNIDLPEMNYQYNSFNTPIWLSSGIGRNVKFEFGPTNILNPGGTLQCDYKVHIPTNTASNIIACNSFAGNSKGSYIVDNSTITFDNIATESDIACLTSVDDDTIPTPCICCDTFDIDIQSSVVKIDQDWFVESNLTTGPNPIIEIKAAMVNFYMNEQPGCERCVAGNILFGGMLPIVNPEPNSTSQINWDPPSGAWIDPIVTLYNNYELNHLNINPREFVWHSIINDEYISRPPLTNEQVNIKVMLPPVFQNQCCSDTIDFCIRWTFTDLACRTCDTLICYTIIQTWNEGSNIDSPIKEKPSAINQSRIDKTSFYAKSIMEYKEPADGAKINPDQPVLFSWTTSCKCDQVYDIKIVEIRKGQSTESALKENPAFFEKKGINTTSFQYPVGEQKFELGTEYAWDVTANKVDGGDGGEDDDCDGKTAESFRFSAAILDISSGNQKPIQKEMIKPKRGKSKKNK